MKGFIAVHIGAGSHSATLQKRYEKLCRDACRKGVEILNSEGGAVLSAASAVALLEDSPLTNAGIGSNLSWDGSVECDAGIMNGSTLTSASIGAVSCIKNPILLASNLLDAQTKPLSLRRVPPCMLVSSGAVQWARENGIPITEPSKLITERAQKNHRHFKKKAEKSDQAVAKVTWGGLE